MVKNVITLIIIVVIIYVFYLSFLKTSSLNKIELSIKNKNYSLEVAQTLAQKSQGLMNRSALCPNCGMIFVSSFEIPQVFWMKNTLIPLDIIFLNQNGQVINIESSIPEPQTPDLKLKHYRSLTPAKYVIELNQGDAQKLKLIPGDQINLPQF